MTFSVTRRALLTTGTGIAGAGVAGGCSSRRPSAVEHGVHRVHYGDGSKQYADLYRPTGTARGTIVVVHGGYWFAEYTLDLMRPICRALAARGWAAWNVEYRGIGDGGGWPTTFQDVAAAVDHVAQVDVPHDDVRLVGHSAGGQLAVWAASRTSATPGGAPRVKPTRVVSLAGVLDLTLGSRQGLGGHAVDRLMGGTPSEAPDRYALGDPTLLLPAAAPVACVHGRDDDTVPLDQSTGYVAAARRAGGTASFTAVAGDHFAIIDPATSSWRAAYRLLSSR